jgi:prephenate dehydratase
VYLHTNQCLLGHVQDHGQPSPPLTPTEKGSSQHFEFASRDSLGHLNHIKHIYPYPQAFGQCDTFLSKHLPHITRHEVSSTAASAAAAAAQIADKDPSKASAAIGGAAAAAARSRTHRPRQQHPRCAGQ